MAATFAGADTVGTAVTSENAPATIAPITIERIASPLVTHQPTLAGRSELINRLLGSNADAGCSRGRERNRENGAVESCRTILVIQWPVPRCGDYRPFENQRAFSRPPTPHEGERRSLSWRACQISKPDRLSQSIFPPVQGGTADDKQC